MNYYCVEFPLLWQLKELPANELHRGKDIGHQITIGTYDGPIYILKKHVFAVRDWLFRRELEAFSTCDFASEHVVNFIGYTMNAEDEVEAMVLEFRVSWDLRWYLRQNKLSDLKLKSKWVAQIAHGLMAIYKRGITYPMRKFCA